MNSVLEGFRVKRLAVIQDAMDVKVVSRWEMAMVKFLGMKDMSS